jgi:hypothetical protein
VANVAGPGKGDRPRSPPCAAKMELYLSRSASLRGAEAERRIGSMGDTRKRRGANADAVMAMD